MKYLLNKKEHEKYLKGLEAIEQVEKITERAIEYVEQHGCLVEKTGYCVSGSKKPNCPIYTLGLYKFDYGNNLKCLADKFMDLPK